MWINPKTGYEDNPKVAEIEGMCPVGEKLRSMFINGPHVGRKHLMVSLNTGKDDSDMETTKGGRMRCPRRDENPINSAQFPEEDYWEPDDTCSYCGSLNPDTLMARIEAGDVEIGPTDKSYKAYIKNLRGKKFQQNHTRKCPDVMKCDRRTCTHWTVDFRDETKFYFPHFSVEQRKRFTELNNEKKLKIGYPGHFYVWPYFWGKK